METWQQVSKERATFGRSKISILFNGLLRRPPSPPGVAASPFSAARQDLPFALQKAAA
jgi:hypothetical protein